MDRFMLDPLIEGYGFTPGNNLREQALEGGMPRQVPVFLGAVHTVNVSVVLASSAEQEYFWAFWQDKQYRPANWKWRLALDGGDLQECECRFISSSLPQESFRAPTWIKISFQVLVKPKKRDRDNDRNIIEIWQSGAGENIDDIEKIPNVWMPDALGRNP